MFEYTTMTLAQMTGEEDAPPGTPSLPADQQGAGNGEAQTNGETQQLPDRDGGSQEDQGGGGGGAGLGGFLIPLVLIAVLWFVLIGGSKKREKKQKQMIASLSKGDRVTTVGGMIGTIVEMRDDEIVLKVDENTNTRIKFSRAAVQSKLDDKD